jgi:hypothetical protein
MFNFKLRLSNWCGYIIIIANIICGFIVNEFRDLLESEGKIYDEQEVK